MRVPTGRPTRSEGHSPRCSRPPSFELHARVDCLVDQVREQVDDHRRERDIDGDRLDHREIAALDGEDHFAADARDREEALDQERAGQQARQLASCTFVMIGIDALRSTCTHMTRSFGHALRARRAHVVLVDLVQKERAVQPQVRRERTTRPIRIGSAL